MNWTWETINGTISKKLAYEAISLELDTIKNKWWYNNLWKWMLPLKLKLFTGFLWKVKS